MLQKVSQIHKRGALLLIATMLAFTAGSVGVASARKKSGDRHQDVTPVWEQVDREVKVNPDNEAPTEVLADIVSLKVTYRNFKKQTKQGVVEVNKDLKDDVLTFFKYAYYLNFPINKVAVSSDDHYDWNDEKLMKHNVTSCFNYRTTSSGNPSQHALGRACDINPRQNPYITLDDQGNPDVQPKGASWAPGVYGTLHDKQPLVQLMKSKGWTWGGDWTLQDTDGAVIDYQHFQKRAAAPQTP